MTPYSSCRRSYWSSSYSGSSWSAVLLVVIILASPQTILPSHGQRGRAATASGSCELPAAWEGRWFEHGERKAVSIEGGSVSHKGECVDRRGDMYVFEDRDELYKNRFSRKTDSQEEKRSLGSPNGKGNDPFVDFPG